MRILFVSSEYPPLTDGIGAFVASVAPALVRRGHEVAVLTCVPGQDPSDRVEDGVRVHRRGQVRIPGLRTVVRSDYVALRLRAAASVWLERRRLPGRFDVIEIPDFLAEGLALGLVGRTPLVANLHTPIGLAVQVTGQALSRGVRISDALERFAARRARVVTAPSALLASSLTAQGWLRPRPWARHGDVRVVPNAIDLERWAKAPDAGGTAPVVLVAGRLERRKAPEIALEACALLRDEVPGLELVLVGRSEEARDGQDYGEWLADRAASAGVALRLVEHVPRHELPAWYARARVVAVPSRYDNFPMVALEAMASARPVVCTRATGTADLLDGSAGGAVVPVDDAPALAAALRPYLLDPAHAAAAGAEALRVVADRCSPDAIAAQRESAYTDARRLAGRAG